MRPRRPLSKSLFLPISPSSVTYASLPLIQPSQPRSRLLRVMKRWALMGGGLLVVLLGILIAPLPGPGGIPVIAVATLADLIGFLADSPQLAANLEAVEAYRDMYGVAAAR